MDFPHSRLAFARFDVSIFSSLSRNPITSVASLDIMKKTILTLVLAAVLAFGSYLVAAEKVDKEGETNPKVTRIPMLEPLRQALEAFNATQKVIGMTWISHTSGRPYNAKTISSWFVDQVKAAGLGEGLTPHGIRKRAATYIADEGASTKQMMAVFGWKKPEQAEVYTAAAEAKRLAKEGLEKLKVTTENQVD